MRRLDALRVLLSGVVLTAGVVLLYLLALRYGKETPRARTLVFTPRASLAGVDGTHPGPAPLAKLLASELLACCYSSRDAWKPGYQAVRP